MESFPLINNVSLQRKKMKHKEIVLKTEEMLRNGSNKEQIFRELGGTDDIARTIASIPYYEKRKQYKTQNLILVGIVFYYAAVKLLISAFNFMSVDLPVYLFPLTLFVPACAVAFGIGIYKFRGYWYLPAGMFGIVALLKNLGPEMAEFNILLWGVWAAINLPLLVGVFISFRLKKKLCPFLGFMGAKTNESGRYLFLEKAG